MSDPRPARLAAVREALATAHLDALLVTALPNIRYLTGFSGTSALLVVTARELLFVSDFRYETQAAVEVGALAQRSIQPQSLWAGLWQQLPALLPAGAVGFESAHLLHRDFQRLLDAGARWQWRPTVDLVEARRERKDAGEVAAIAEAAEVAVAALRSALDAVRPGRRETEVAGALEHALRDAGSEAFPFPSIVASGPRSALPHARTSERELAAGDFLLLDFGAVVRGYCADVTRTVVVGRASERQRELYDVVRGANAAAVAGIRPGMLGRDADALARDYIDRCGHGPRFGHSLGHGLGLEVHEAPRLSRAADAPVPAGAVVTIEPGIYLPDWGGIRIEDDVVIEPRGVRVLTDFPRDLLELT